MIHDKMTIEEIDAEIERVKEANKGNFCKTFEFMDLDRLERMREALIKEKTQELSQQQNPQPPQPLEGDSHA